MRVSTNTIFEHGVHAMLQQQEELLKIQQQVSTGRRIVSPSDDPVAAARALELSQAVSLNGQYSDNRNHARSSLAEVETTLNSVTTLIQDVRTLTISAGNAALSDADRAVLVEELRGRLEDLIGLANATDSAGRYLFSGYQAMTKPFTTTAAGVQYAGDQGQRLVQVSASRGIAISESGAALFEHIRDGNGVFTTAAAPTNGGTGLISPGSVVDPSALTGHSYEIRFAVAGGVTTYDIVDVTTFVTLSAGNAYASGDAIRFDGLQVEIQGAPADGDRFTVSPSANRSLFRTIGDLIGVISEPVTNTAARARLTNGINTALVNLDRALENILAARAAVGARLQELDSLDRLGEDLAVQYQQSLSQLQDLDYASALSELSRRQLYLEAAQKSFLRVSGLSLFDQL
jgi:flagellar hook-associated protein 3 FlgL